MSESKTQKFLKFATILQSTGLLIFSINESYNNSIKLKNYASLELQKQEEEEEEMLSLLEKIKSAFTIKPESINKEKANLTTDVAISSTLISISIISIILTGFSGRDEKSKLFVVALLIQAIGLLIFSVNLIYKKTVNLQDYENYLELIAQNTEEEEEEMLPLSFLKKIQSAFTINYDKNKAMYSTNITVSSILLASSTIGIILTALTIFNIKDNSYMNNFSILTLAIGLLGFFTNNIYYNSISLKNYEISLELKNFLQEEEQEEEEEEEEMKSLSLLEKIRDAFTIKVEPINEKKAIKTTNIVISSFNLLICLIIILGIFVIFINNLKY